MLLQNKELPVRINLPDDRGYELLFAPLQALPVRMREAGLRPGKCLVITDTNVASHYRNVVVGMLQLDGWDPFVLSLPPGEVTKSPKHLTAIYDAALSWNIDRHTPVLALGGGVIGDVVGESDGSVEVCGWREAPAVGGIAGQGALRGIGEVNVLDGEGVTVNIGEANEEISRREGQLRIFLDVGERNTDV